MDENSLSVITAGSIPSIKEEYEKIPEKETAGHAEFVNDMDYNGKLVILENEKVCQTSCC